MKKVSDLSKFNDTLPYASELFGVYQPLIGWKSKIVKKRIERSLQNAKIEILREIQQKVVVDNDFRPNYVLENRLSIQNLGNSQIGNSINQLLSPKIEELLSGTVKITDILSENKISELLNQALQPIAQMRVINHGLVPEAINTHNIEKLNESKTAGMIGWMAKNAPDELLDIVQKSNKNFDFKQRIADLDPFLGFEVTKDSKGAFLSPIGIIHLFRQYFFEFDTFLGSPVGHIWLSPGSSVELLEVSTRKTIIERTFEQSTETITKNEREVKSEDEISDQIKRENENNTKFGASVSGSGGIPKVVEISGSTNFSLDNTQKNSQEATHKQMRSQSDKISSEIRNNFKSTFKTFTETQDTTSKRYVLQNKTKKLINYELRRKMRRVGIQTQHIGIALSWQSYVDNAGDELGVANLVHVATSPEYAGLVPPDQIVVKDRIEKIEQPFTFPYTGNDPDEKDQNYIDGSDGGGGVFESEDNIEPRMSFKCTAPAVGYNLVDVKVTPQPGPSVKQLVIENIKPTGEFTIFLKEVNFNDSPAINFNVIGIWQIEEAEKQKIIADNKVKSDTFTSAKSKTAHEEFTKTARERIKLASNISTRPYEDLREEERTIVFRNLIRMLTKYAKKETYDNKAKHVYSELIKSIFDIDKMLYFVAPEWWQPRERSVQSFGFVQEKDADGNLVNVGISDSSIVNWKDSRELNRPNYFITEVSAKAKLGSSLGWLLQLDGDNLRNAFLNSPWVKAVLPIRPGKEEEALRWLQQNEVEGVEGIDEPYHGSEAEFQGKTIKEVLDILAKKVKETNTDFKAFLQTEKVFENGFSKLQNSFEVKPFEVYDQWTEILPTDQIVAVPVEYDPKTGIQI